MPKPKTRSGWRALESLFDAGALGRLSDGELLECFLTNRDTLAHEAFRVLVERHGPMVLGRCRSLVCDPHEADDAFQATFLVLVRKAESIRRRDTIAPWLYGVAGRVARRARHQTERRRRREVEASDEIPCSDPPVGEAPNAEALIHDEIARLSDSFRAPIVLCCLEGLGYDHAAQMLGIPESTLRGRLSRARKKLAARLHGRGITPGALASALEPARLTFSAVSSSLVDSTVLFSTRWSSVRGLLSGATVVPESITGLARGVIKTMLLQSIKVSALAAFVTAGVLGTVLVAQQGRQPGGGSSDTTAHKPSAAAAVSQTAKPAQKEQTKAVIEELNHLYEAENALRNERVEKLLDLAIDAEFPKGVTLHQLLKHIKQQTTNLSPPGLPIFVNPLGLREMKTKMDDVVTLNEKNASTRAILDRALGEVGLSFQVRDGFLSIDSRTGLLEAHVQALDRKLDRLLKALDRSEKAK